MDILPVQVTCLFLAYDSSNILARLWQISDISMKISHQIYATHSLILNTVFHVDHIHYQCHTFQTKNRFSPFQLKLNSKLKHQCYGYTKWIVQCTVILKKHLKTIIKEIISVFRVWLFFNITLTHDLNIFAHMWRKLNVYN